MLLWQQSAGSAAPVTAPMSTAQLGLRVSSFAIAASIGVLRAWQLRFVQDDAYISWRYADHLVRGDGLVWNEGERVEGYTNFLWTLIVTIPHAFSLDVEAFVTIVGLVLFTVTLAIFYVLVGALTRSWTAAALATLILGLFPSFAAYATGGLETQLQACLLVATAALVVRSMQRESVSVSLSAAIGTTAALALLTRLDSVVMAAPLVALHVWWVLATDQTRRASAVAVAVGIPLLICGSWLVWKLGYYGSLLPNTYRAKVDGLEGLTREGLRYVRSFVQAYAFYLPIACAPAGVWLAWEGRLDRRLIAVIAVPPALWIAYVVRVGGDFMEYRLLIPALPFVLAVTYWVMCELDPRRARAAVLTSVVLGGGIWSYGSDQVPKPFGSPLPLQEIALRREWFEIGTILGEAFADSVQPRIAVTPAGAIPYLSRLPTVDMLGLNDADVREFLYRGGELIGHRRLVPLDLLIERRVNFLIGRPLVRAASDARYGFTEFCQRRYPYADDYKLKGRHVIEVPLSGARMMLMIYLTEDPAVTKRMEELGWRQYPLE